MLARFARTLLAIRFYWGTEAFAAIFVYFQDGLTMKILIMHRCHSSNVYIFLKNDNWAVVNIHKQYQMVNIGIKYSKNNNNNRFAHTSKCQFVTIFLLRKELIFLMFCQIGPNDIVCGQQLTFKTSPIPRWLCHDIWQWNNQYPTLSATNLKMVNPASGTATLSFKRRSN